MQSGSIYLSASPSTHPLNQEDIATIKNTKESYYTNFTKYILTNQPCTNSVYSTYSYKNWIADQTSLQSLQLAQLKSISKTAGLHVSGKKQELIQRLNAHYRRIGCAILIQRIFRGFLVRECERMRGPGYPNTNICLNVTDFHSMDSLGRIPREEFFSYSDASGFVYGFNVFSLMAMFKRNRKMVNPYNREDIPIPIVCRVFSIYKKILLLYPLTCNLTRFDEQSKELAQIVSSESRMREDEATAVSSVTFNSNTNTEESISIDADETPMEILSRLTELQINYTIDERIRMVFERMSELLERHCQPRWFCNLSSHEYDRFYHYYYVWWSRPNTRFSAEELKCVYPLDNPFHHLNTFDENTSTQLYRTACIELVERMVYCGISEYWQRIGAKQVLTILSIVSIQARNSIPGLFEELH